MQARVNITGEIVTIMKNIGYPGGYVASNGRTYHDEDLTLIVDEEPDYWARLEHQYAGMAMQGMLAGTYYQGLSHDRVIEDAQYVAHTLVEKVRYEENPKELEGLKKELEALKIEKTILENKVKLLKEERE